jgi:hypothetical protein
MQTPDGTEIAGDAMEWDFSFPLATNRFFLYDMAKALFWTFLIFDIIIISIFLFQKNGEIVLPFLGISGLLLLGFFILILAIALLVFGNRYPVHFRINPEGVQYESRSRRGAALNRAAMILGMLAGKPSVAGAGILAVSQESSHVDWEEVHRIRDHTAQGVITVMNRWRVVVRLYCAPEDYSRILALVWSYAAAGALRRQQSEQTAVSRPSAVPRCVLFSMLALAASTAVMACPFEVDGTAVLVVLACTLLAIWVPGIGRFAAALALAGISMIAYGIVRLGTEVHELVPRAVLKGAEMPRWAQYTEFGSMDARAWTQFGISAAGLVVIGALALAGLLGRLRQRNPKSAPPSGGAGNSTPE